MVDILIIGAGVSGCAIAREASRYKASICVVEKCEDVCCGTSKANSAIIHAGYDAKTGTLMAKLNVEGNRMMDELSNELDFPFRRNGSLVLCLTKEDLPNLHALYERGVANGVPDLTLLTKEEVLGMEPNISDDIAGALYAPTGGIVCPFSMNIAFAENAAVNGVDFRFDTSVEGIVKKNGVFEVKTSAGIIMARTIVNAAGVYADEIHNMVSGEKLHITPRRGDYFLLDKSAGSFVSHTVFTLPGSFGKGVLTAPTVHGNIIIGPTAIDVDDKESTNTTRDGLDTVDAKVRRNFKNPPLRQVITSFAGLRAHEDGGEFIIGEANDCENFIDCAGIESPGLSSCPAIGVMVANMLKEKLELCEKDNFIAKRRGVLNPEKLSFDERQQLIREKPEYGNIICRCEMVTEGEILDAIHRPLGARSLDGVKRRTRAGMGRCQAGFCSPRTMEILSRELGVSMLDITKCGNESKLLAGVTKNHHITEGSRQ